MADGVLFTDPYPGYAALERRWLEANGNYTDTKADLIDNLRGIRDKANAQPGGIAAQSPDRRPDHAVRLRGQAIVKLLGFRPAFPFDAKGTKVIP